MQTAALTSAITEPAERLVFSLCGVVAAERFAELEHFEEWLARGYAGEMKYLEDPRRRDPALALDGVRSIIVCGLNYNTAYPYSTQVVADQAQRAAGRDATERDLTEQDGA